MKPAALLLAVVGIVMSARPVASAPSSLALEHSFDGRSFLPAGTIQLVRPSPCASRAPFPPRAPGLINTRARLPLPQDGGSATLDYGAGLPDQRAAFAEAVRDGGMYFVRLPPSGGAAPPVVASIPARCWAQGGARVVLHVLDGAVLAAALEAPCTAAALRAAPASSGLPRPGVEVQSPVPAPEVRLAVAQAQAGPAAGPPLPGALGGQPPPAAQQQQQQRPGAPDGKGGKAPPPDDRTFLQKNWMFLALGAYIFMRMGMAAEMPPPPGPPGSGAPAPPAR
jgi:hypothetical protein